MPALRRLRHNFLSDEMIDRVRAALPGVAVAGEGGFDEEDPYVAVSE